MWIPWSCKRAVVRPAVQNSTNIADPGSASGGTFQCMQFVSFFINFSYLSYLGHLSLLGLQTKTRNSSTFCSFKSHNPETFMSSAATAIICVNQLTMKLKSTSSHPWRLNNIAIFPGPTSLFLSLPLLTHTPTPCICTCTIS